jgi:hypothetical protein
MRKPTERYTETFTADFGGKTYSCERVVIGSDRFTQRIHVIGVGSKDDSAI